MNYTYLVRCSDGSLYCGWTNDPEKRLAAHNAGTGAKYTKSRRPVELVYSESFETKEEAMSREWHIKRLTRQQKEELLRKAGTETNAETMPGTGTETNAETMPGTGTETDRTAGMEAAAEKSADRKL